MLSGAGAPVGWEIGVLVKELLATLADEEMFAAGTGLGCSGTKPASPEGVALRGVLVT